MRINIAIEPLIGFLIIGLVAGFLAEQIIRGRGAGLVINLVVGVIGAFIGGFLFGFLKLAFLTDSSEPWLVLRSGRWYSCSCSD